MLEIRAISKSYGKSSSSSLAKEQPALTGVTLSVKRGEIVCLLGPSGCGKTTLLRIVAGLEEADRGEIWLDGEDLAATPVHKRNFGFMFQEFALFPHRNVEQNIAFGLRMAGASKAAIEARVREMLELVNLSGFGKRSIFELSGGERQRVALARSLAPNPRLLMLDEPLGSLDRSLREELMGELRTILKRIGQTVLFVTHDQQEALALADRVVVMNRGAIEQVATPQALHQQPQNSFVARFLGFQNLLPCWVKSENQTVAQTAIGALPLPQTAEAGEYTLLIRPQALRLEPTSAVDMPLTAQVESISFRGDHTRLVLLISGDGEEVRLHFQIPTLLTMQPGSQIKLWLDSAQLQLLPIE